MSNFGCEIDGCEKHPRHGDLIIRTSPKGGPFAGRCEDHFEGDVDPVIGRIADALDPPAPVSVQPVRNQDRNVRCASCRSVAEFLILADGKVWYSSCSRHYPGHVVKARQRLGIVDEVPS